MTGFEPVHLVGHEDIDAACGSKTGPIATYWRKVTCPACLDLIRQAEARRKAAQS